MLDSHNSPLVPTCHCERPVLRSSSSATAEGGSEAISYLAPSSGRGIFYLVVYPSPARRRNTLAPHQISFCRDLVRGHPERSHFTIQNSLFDTCPRAKRRIRYSLRHCKESQFIGTTWQSPPSTTLFIRPRPALSKRKLALSAAEGSKGHGADEHRESSIEYRGLSARGGIEHRASSIEHCPIPPTVQNGSNGS